MNKNHKKQKVRARHNSKLRGKTRSRGKKTSIPGYNDPYFYGTDSSFNPGCNEISKAAAKAAAKTAAKDETINE